jgi:hypothetical protein
MIFRTVFPSWTRHLHPPFVKSKYSKKKVTLTLRGKFIVYLCHLFIAWDYSRGKSIILFLMWDCLPESRVFSLCGASGKTLYWVLLLVNVGPWATHFTGYCCRVNMRGFWQHTLLGIIVGLMWAFSNGCKIIFFKIKVEEAISISPPKPLKRITLSQTKSHGTTSLFPY